MAYGNSPIALSLNFDSLRTSERLSADFRDPTFFSVFDRLADVLNEYGLKLTIFMIGQDLTDPEVFARVRDWHQAGHEIANHSWSHNVAFSTLKRNEIYDEVSRSHEILTKACGVEPRGFTAPSWSASKVGLQTLIDLGYSYDASLFPSFWLYPAQVKAAWNHRANGKAMLSFLRRRDWHFPFCRPKSAFISNADYKPARESDQSTIVVMPMPTLNRLWVPCWHTIGFVLSRPYLDKLLNASLRDIETFYYLMHPADVIFKTDLPTNTSTAFERMSENSKDKMDAIYRAFDAITKSGRPIVTMDQLATTVRMRSLASSELSGQTKRPIETSHKSSRHSEA